MTSPNGSTQLAAQIAGFGAKLAELQARITQLERGAGTAQLGSASIEAGSVVINDPAGVPQILLGQQDDGTFAHVALNATPPPQPSDPTVTPAIMSAMVAWDGNMAGGSPTLADFAGMQVHCSISPNFTPGPNTLQSTFIAQGVRPVGGLLAGYTYYICLVAINQAGLTGPSSNVVPVVPSQAISPGQVITQPVLVGSTTLGYATTTPRGPEFFDFEVGLQGFFVDAGSGVTLGLDPTTAFTGQQSAMITCDGVTWPGVVSPQFAVVAGDPVWVQFIYQASINLNQTFVGIRWFDQAGNFLYETDVGPAPISGEPGQWWAFSVGDNAPQAGFCAVVFGDQEVLPAGTQIWFDTVEVSGNLGFAFSATTGVDQVGNTYNQGVSIYGLPGLQEALAVYDAAGRNVNAAIDAAGNFTGQNMSANTDMFLAGSSLLNTILPELPQGLVAWVSIPAASLPYPSSMSAVSTEIDLWELDVQTVAGREYLMVIPPLIVLCSATTVNVTIQINYTTDGSAPTTSSPIWTRINLASVTGNIRSQSSAQHFSSNGGLLYRFYAMIFKNASSGYQIALNSEAANADDPYSSMSAGAFIYDMGQTIPATGSVNLGTSGGSAPPPKTTYTKTYNVVHTYSYQGGDGGNPNLKIDTDGNAYQGGDYANTYNGRAKTFLQMAAAQASDLSGATINWVKLYLNNNHTWYNSGMTLSLGSVSKSTFGSTASDPSSPNWTHFTFSEGQAKWITLPSSFYNAVSDPVHWCLGMYAGSNSLSYYGYFAGAAQSGRPQIQVNYTK
jgi:hypothetical protein